MAPNDTRSMQRAKPALVVAAVAVALIAVAYFAGSGGASSSAPSTTASTNSTSPSTSSTSTSSTTTTSTQPPPPTDLGTFRSSAPSPAACGSELPVEVTVGSVEAIKGPAPSTPSVGRQVVRHWTTPERTVELRWPPDPRELSTDPKHTGAAEVQVGSWEMSSQSVVTVRANPDNSALGPVLFVLTQKPRTNLGRLSPRCSVVQFRVTAANGTRQTVGLSLPLSALNGNLIDLGPLVHLRHTSQRAVPVDRSVECPTQVSGVAAVRAAKSNSTPAGALSDFIESDAGRELPQPSSSSPFTETHLTSDNTYRYEHFLAWSEYVAITVERQGSGWAVTHWEHGEC